MRFILYTPKGVKTGGPEAIHQLNYALKELGFECYLLATWGTGKRRAIPEYNMYSPNFIHWWSLKRGDIVVVPEYFSRIPYYISKRVSAIVFWWLSVDNCPFVSQKNWKSSNHITWSEYPESKDIRKNPLFRRLLNIPRYIRFESKIIALNVTNKLYEIVSSKIKLDEVLHVFQSNYAKEYVGYELKLEGLMVSDYTRQLTELTIQQSEMVEFDKQFGDFLVAYNPSKGLANVLNIERFLGPNVKLIPLQGFSYSQILYLFDKVDLYLDLGNLPGKDRLPREAILAGCPIMITNLGAGHNSKDFPVPNKYKLKMDITSPMDAAHSVLEILKLGKSENLKMQKLFRESVSKEKTIFDREVSEFVRQFAKI